MKKKQKVNVETYKKVLLLCSGFLGLVVLFIIWVNIIFINNPTEKQVESYQAVELYEIGDTNVFPRVGVIVHEDPIWGWNLQLDLMSFEFKPDKVGSINEVGEGHAYLYINDKLTSRLYSDWTHISELPKGDLTFKVTLNGNDGRQYARLGQPVEATRKLAN